MLLVKYIFASVEFDFLSYKSGDAVTQGMLYIHGSILGFHGNLKSSNCVVTSRWVLQITDFGLHELRHCAESDSIGEHQYYRSKFLLEPVVTYLAQVRVQWCILIMYLWIPLAMGNFLTSRETNSKDCN